MPNVLVIFGANWCYDWRTQLTVGETVLILGATGVTGKLAIQTAKLLGDWTGDRCRNPSRCYEPLFRFAFVTVALTFAFEAETVDCVDPRNHN